MRFKLPLYVLLLLALTATARPALADNIPYAQAGTVAPTNTFSAISTGSVTAYFFGFSAADTDKVQMCNVTQGSCSAFVFNNQTTAVGTSANFGSVNAGDKLIFSLDNLSKGYILSSDPAQSIDAINHAYATADSGGVSGVPAGLFLGMEDLKSPGADLDYNDDQFVLTNVTTAVNAPEPSASLLLSIGMLGLIGLKRRQLSQQF
jgi:hypothetical protein